MDYEFTLLSADSLAGDSAGKRELQDYRIMI
jgi:hypothetical protein